VRSYRPTFEVSLAREALGFDDDEQDECVQFLMNSGCFLEPTGTSIDPKQSHLTEVQESAESKKDQENKNGVTDGLL
jgi:hypothetical protein